MPMWHVYHPKNAYNAAEKREFAACVTAIYAEIAKLPKFYVGVVFHEFSEENFFVGGEPRDSFVRIWVDHIARHRFDPEDCKRWMDIVNQRLSPFLAGRGLHSEIHIDNTPTELWTIDGFFPPPAGSPDERRWNEENRPSPPTA